MSRSTPPGEIASPGPLPPWESDGGRFVLRRRGRQPERVGLTRSAATAPVAKEEGGRVEGNEARAVGWREQQRPGRPVSYSKERPPTSEAERFEKPQRRTGKSSSVGERSIQEENSARDEKLHTRRTAGPKIVPGHVHGQAGRSTSATSSSVPSSALSPRQHSQEHTQPQAAKRAFSSSQGSASVSPRVNRRARMSTGPSGATHGSSLPNSNQELPTLRRRVRGSLTAPTEQLGPASAPNNELLNGKNAKGESANRVPTGNALRGQAARQGNSRGTDVVSARASTAQVSNRGSNSESKAVRRADDRGSSGPPAASSRTSEPKKALTKRESILAFMKSERIKKARQRREEEAQKAKEAEDLKRALSMVEQKRVAALRRSSPSRGASVVGRRSSTVTKSPGGSKGDHQANGTLPVKRRRPLGGQEKPAWFKVADSHFEEQEVPLRRGESGVARPQSISVRRHRPPSATFMVPKPKAPETVAVAKGSKEGVEVEEARTAPAGRRIRRDTNGRLSNNMSCLEGASGKVDMMPQAHDEMLTSMGQSMCTSSASVSLTTSHHTLGEGSIAENLLSQHEVVESKKTEARPAALELGSAMPTVLGIPGVSSDAGQDKSVSLAPTTVAAPTKSLVKADNEQEHDKVGNGGGTLGVCSPFVGKEVNLAGEAIGSDSLADMFDWKPPAQDVVCPTVEMGSGYRDSVKGSRKMGSQEASASAGRVEDLSSPCPVSPIGANDQDPGANDIGVGELSSNGHRRDVSGHLTAVALKVHDLQQRPAQGLRPEDVLPTVNRGQWEVSAFSGATVIELKQERDREILGLGVGEMRWQHQGKGGLADLEGSRQDDSGSGNCLSNGSQAAVFLHHKDQDMNFGNALGGVIDCSSKKGEGVTFLGGAGQHLQGGKGGISNGSPNEALEHSHTHGSSLGSRYELGSGAGSLRDVSERSGGVNKQNMTPLHEWDRPTRRGKHLDYIGRHAISSVDMPWAKADQLSTTSSEGSLGGQFTMTSLIAERIVSQQAQESAVRKGMPGQEARAGIRIRRNTSEVMSLAGDEEDVVQGTLDAVASRAGLPINEPKVCPTKDNREIGVSEQEQGVKQESEIERVEDEVMVLKEERANEPNEEGVRVGGGITTGEEAEILAQEINRSKVMVSDAEAEGQTDGNMGNSGRYGGDARLGRLPELNPVRVPMRRWTEQHQLYQNGNENDVGRGSDEGHEGTGWGGRPRLSPAALAMQLSTEQSLQDGLHQAELEVVGLQAEQGALGVQHEAYLNSLLLRRQRMQTLMLNRGALRRGTPPSALAAAPEPENAASAAAAVGAAAGAAARAAAVAAERAVMRRDSAAEALSALLEAAGSAGGGSAAVAAAAADAMELNKENNLEEEKQCRMNGKEANMDVAPWEDKRSWSQGDQELEAEELTNFHRGGEGRQPAHEVVDNGMGVPWRSGNAHSTDDSPLDSIVPLESCQKEEEDGRMGVNSRHWVPTSGVFPLQDVNGTGGEKVTESCDSKSTADREMQQIQSLETSTSDVFPEEMETLSSEVDFQISKTETVPAPEAVVAGEEEEEVALGEEGLSEEGVVQVIELSTSVARMEQVQHPELSSEVEEVCEDVSGVSMGAPQRSGSGVNGTEGHLLMSGGSDVGINHLSSEYNSSFEVAELATVVACESSEALEVEGSNDDNGVPEDLSAVLFTNSAGMSSEEVGLPSNESPVVVIENTVQPLRVSLGSASNDDVASMEEGVSEANCDHSPEEVSNHELSVKSLEMAGTVSSPPIDEVEEACSTDEDYSSRMDNLEPTSSTSVDENIALEELGFGEMKNQRADDRSDTGDESIVSEEILNSAVSSMSVSGVVNEIVSSGEVGASTGPVELGVDEKDSQQGGKVEVDEDCCSQNEVSEEVPPSEKSDVSKVDVKQIPPDNQAFPEASFAEGLVTNPEEVEVETGAGAGCDKSSGKDEDTSWTPCSDDSGVFTRKSTDIDSNNCIDIGNREQSVTVARAENRSSHFQNPPLPPTPVPSLGYSLLNNNGYTEAQQCAEGPPLADWIRGGGAVEGGRVRSSLHGPTPAMMIAMAKATDDGEDSFGSRSSGLDDTVESQLVQEDEHILEKESAAAVHLQALFRGISGRARARSAHLLQRLAATTVESGVGTVSEDSFASENSQDLDVHGSETAKPVKQEAERAGALVVSTDGAGDVFDRDVNDQCPSSRLIEEPPVGGGSPAPRLTRAALKMAEEKAAEAEAEAVACEEKEAEAALRLKEAMAAHAEATRMAMKKRAAAAKAVSVLSAAAKAARQWTVSMMESAVLVTTLNAEAVVKMAAETEEQVGSPLECGDMESSHQSCPVPAGAIADGSTDHRESKECMDDATGTEMVTATVAASGGVVCASGDEKVDVNDIVVPEVHLVAEFSAGGKEMSEEVDKEGDDVEEDIVDESDVAGDADEVISANAMENSAPQEIYGPEVEVEVGEEDIEVADSAEDIDLTGLVELGASKMTEVLTLEEEKKGGEEVSMEVEKVEVKFTDEVHLSQFDALAGYNYTEPVGTVEKVVSPMVAPGVTETRQDWGVIGGEVISNGAEEREPQEVQAKAVGHTRSHWVRGPDMEVDSTAVGGGVARVMMEESENAEQQGIAAANRRLLLVEHTTNMIFGSLIGRPWGRGISHLYPLGQGTPPCPEVAPTTEAVTAVMPAVGRGLERRVEEMTDITQNVVTNLQPDGTRARSSEREGGGEGKSEEVGFVLASDDSEVNTAVAGVGVASGVEEDDNVEGSVMPLLSQSIEEPGQKVEEGGEGIEVKAAVQDATVQGSATTADADCSDEHQRTGCMVSLAQATEGGETSSYPGVDVTSVTPLEAVNTNAVVDGGNPANDSVGSDNNLEKGEEEEDSEEVFDSEVEQVGMEAARKRLLKVEQTTDLIFSSLFARPGVKGTALDLLGGGTFPHPAEDVSVKEVMELEGAVEVEEAGVVNESTATKLQPGGPQAGPCDEEETSDSAQDRALGGKGDSNAVTGGETNVGGLTPSIGLGQIRDGSESKEVEAEEEEKENDLYDFTSTSNQSVVEGRGPNGGGVLALPGGASMGVLSGGVTGAAVQGQRMELPPIPPFKQRTPPRPKPKVNLWVAASDGRDFRLDLYRSNKENKTTRPWGIWGHGKSTDPDIFNWKAAVGYIVEVMLQSISLEELNTAMQENAASGRPVLPPDLVRRSDRISKEVHNILQSKVSGPLPPLKALSKHVLVTYDAVNEMLSERSKCMVRTKPWAEKLRPPGRIIAVNENFQSFNSINEAAGLIKAELESIDGSCEHGAEPNYELRECILGHREDDNLKRHKLVLKHDVEDKLFWGLICDTTFELQRIWRRKAMYLEANRDEGVPEENEHM